METLHARDPAVRICSLALHVGADLLVGEEQEVLVADRVHNHLRNIFWLEDSVLAGLSAGRELVPRIEVFADDVRAYRLGAEHRHLHARVAIVNRKPFGEGHGCSLGNGVGARVDLGE